MGTKVLVIRHTRPSSQPTFSVIMAPDHLQIALRGTGDDYSEIVIFTGDCFSPEEYERRDVKTQEYNFFTGVDGGKKR